MFRYLLAGMFGEYPEMVLKRHNGKNSAISDIRQAVSLRDTHWLLPICEPFLYVKK